MWCITPFTSVLAPKVLPRDSRMIACMDHVQSAPQPARMPRFWPPRARATRAGLSFCSRDDLLGLCDSRDGQDALSDGRAESLFALFLVTQRRAGTIARVRLAVIAKHYFGPAPDPTQHRIERAGVRDNTVDVPGDGENGGILPTAQENALALGIGGLSSRLRATNENLVSSILQVSSCRRTQSVSQ
jgi:hypothetical protein